ncbi:hypothetical protein FRC17_000622 [Serendipita sp. 399]|nr:hypothetical protein FRC17_000622 [Serendipita sp. 399]
MSSFFRKKVKKRNKKANQPPVSLSEGSSSPKPGPIDEGLQEDAPDESRNIESSDISEQPNPSKIHGELHDLAEQFFAIVKEVSEATDLLAPLKSASMLMTRIIQTSRAVHDNRTAWLDLCEDLLPHVSDLESYKAILESKAISTDQSSLGALKGYLK